MTISVLQDRQFSTGGAQISSLSLAFSSPVTAGSAIHGLGTSQAATNTFSDNNGNTWPGSILDTVNDTVGGVTVFHNTTQNCNAGSTTVTISFSAANSFNCIWIREIGGAKSTGNPDGHNIVFSSSTTSQALSASNTTQPALISALSINSNSQETPVLDGSLTASTANPGWDYATGNNGGVAGHKRITTTGSQSITNTQASADALVTVMAIFLESTGGGAAATNAPSRRAIPLYRAPPYVNIARTGLSRVMRRRLVPVAPSAYPLTLTEAASAADAEAGVLVALGSTSDAASAADSTTNSNSALGATTDAASASDSLSLAGSSFGVPETEAASAADAYTGGNANTGSTSDGGTASDSSTPALTALASSTEAASAVDSAATGLTTATATSDAAAAADSLLPGNALATATSDSASAADSAATQAGEVTTLSEAASAADSETATGGSANSTVNEAVSASDSLATIAAWVRTLSEASAAADALGSTWNAFIAYTDAASAADLVASGPAQSATYADSAAASDSSSTLQTLQGALSEAVSAAEALLGAMAAIAARSEPASASDAVSGAAQLLGALTEPASSADAYVITGSGAAYSDAAGALDQLANAAAFGRALLEAALSTDQLASTLVTLVPILVGSLRYSIARARGRRFTVAIVTYLQFEPMDPAEQIPLTFDMTPDLAVFGANVTLQGVPTVEVTVWSGIDPSPQSIVASAVGFDIAGKQVIVPVQGGPASEYMLKVTAETSLPNLTLTLTGRIQMLAGA